MSSVSVWTIAWGITLGFIILAIIAWLLGLLAMWLFGNRIQSNISNIGSQLGNQFQNLTNSAGIRY